MKTTKQILENLIDALIEAEPILRDEIRLPLRVANRKLQQFLAEHEAVKIPRKATK